MQPSVVIYAHKAFIRIATGTLDRYVNFVTIFYTVYDHNLQLDSEITNVSAILRLSVV